MKAEDCEIMPPLEFASEEGKELKENLQRSACDKRIAALVTGLEPEIGSSSAMRPSPRQTTATSNN
ncbi:hypothetical protein ACWGQQ_45750 [Bradyrhizobium sp. Lot33]